MRKVLSFTLVLLLVSAVGVFGAELGLEQEWNGNVNLRLENQYVTFSAPLNNKITSFETGLKVPINFGKSYFIGKSTFSHSYHDDKPGKEWGFDTLKLGLGYPLRLDNWTLRGEFSALSPEWSEISEWKFQPSLTLSYRFSFNEVISE